MSALMHMFWCVNVDCNAADVDCNAEWNGISSDDVVDYMLCNADRCAKRNLWTRIITSCCTD